MDVVVQKIHVGGSVVIPTGLLGMDLKSVLVSSKTPVPVVPQVVRAEFAIALDSDSTPSLEKEKRESPFRSGL
jgi:hypothetical protein